MKYIMKESGQVNDYTISTNLLYYSYVFIVSINLLLGTF